MAITLEQTTIAVGKYLVTPLTKITAPGQYAALVSVRRGMYDRVFSFLPRFDSLDAAACYARAEGLSLVQENRLA